MRIVNEIRLSQTVDVKHKDSIEFVQKWKSGEKIPNPQFQKIKTDVSRAFDIATNSTKLKGANEFTVWGFQKEDGETEEYKYSFPNSVLHVPGYLKRTAKQLKRSIKSPKASKIVKDAMTACEPWEKIAVTLKAMKGDVVKRQIGVGSNKPSIPKGTISKEIEEELEKIGKGFEKELQTNFEDYYEMIIDQYQKDSKKKEVTSTYDLYKTKSNYHLNKILNRFLDSKYDHNERGGYAYILKSDYKTILKDTAKQNAKEGVEKFVYKMKMKLSVIVGGRGIGVNVDGNHNRNTMSFEFEDGSRFTVKNGIVLSYSVYGKPFYRYPTTFHNVILPDGKKLNSPSEAKIKKEFVK
jgi:hypothetical protein